MVIHLKRIDVILTWS